MLEQRPEGLTYVADGLELRGDFARMLPRARWGVVQREFLVRAAKVKGLSAQSLGQSAGQGANQDICQDAGQGDGQPAGQSANPGPADTAKAVAAPLAIDATAGLGEDSFLLAAAGFRVRMYENNATMAALLRDALERARVDERTAAIAARMELFEQDSIAALPNLSVQPAVVLLDPMFPARTKSALVKKKFQVIHQFEQPCENEEELLRAACAALPQKIVIKRPPKGPHLAGVKPSYSLAGKGVRYDVLTPPFPQINAN